MDHKKLQIDQLRFEPEPDWDALPDPVPSTEVVKILHIDRKTLTKYQQTGKIARPAVRSANFSAYAKSDVIGFWRTRQVRIAEGYIKLDTQHDFKLGGLEDGDGLGDRDGWGGVDTEWTGPMNEATGPLAGAGVETLPYSETLPEPVSKGDLVTQEAGAGDDLLSLSRDQFRALLETVWRQAQAPLLERLDEADARIGELTATQRGMIEAQGRFLEGQTELQRQQAEAQRQQSETLRRMMAAQEALMQEQRRLTNQVAELTAQLQTQADQDEAERRRAAEEPQTAWERFKRALSLGGGPSRTGTQKRGG